VANSEMLSGVAAVDRALTILSALEAGTEPYTLAELARATGLYKSTILRLIVSLEGGGYVRRLRDGRYVLGASAFRLGHAYERQNSLRQHVLPVLEDLVARGTESSSFHVAHGPGTRLCLFRVNSNHSTLDRVEAGNVLPLDRGAAGRVILAYAGAGGAGHEALRQAGFALSLGERDPACAALAAPTFGPSGEIAGAISLSGPAERFTTNEIARMRKLLIKAAEQLTKSLGGTTPSPNRATGRNTSASGRPLRATSERRAS
jgi:DNA-binding IclR family transcriptional regulator